MPQIERQQTPTPDFICQRLIWEGGRENDIY